MSDTDRPHSDSLVCWCNPHVFAICEACGYTGECDLGIPCGECHGTNMIRLEGDMLAEVLRQYFTESHPDIPAIVVIHVDPLGVFPRLIPAPEPEDTDDDDGEESEGWEQDADSWKK